ncbi:FadR/GntR family transcriptional regulator [Ktedonospora formicarum]|uniref:GntR family transcriptional regulator n=1 Tax=Ktedonospora formicarum TaxID=2778364 RepID=A0A8J3MRU9_9CHLR|nr:FadR/GntR family transcriptional regulator [Ktedonospora formicarum]GHO42650.1 GntR family transcriptional regulator [Ktedonospora formicarum]
MTSSDWAPYGAVLQRSVPDRIKQYILDQHLESGAELPSESELASQLGISRNAVREAIKILQTLDIVETRHGQGTFVGKLSLNALVDGLAFRVLFDGEEHLRTLRELLEIRQVLECGLIQRVPRTIPAEHITELYQLVEAMETQAEQNALSPQEDRAFHDVLYRSLDNKLLIQILQAFWDVFQRVRQTLPGIPPHPQITAQAHRRIVDAVAARDVHAAAAAMQEHFRGISNWVLENPQE